MNRWTPYLPTTITLAACLLMLAHGPIVQPPHYHDFADQSQWLGVPHAADVLSNLGFALVALWGLLALVPQRQHPALAKAWPGYALFLAGLLLTAFGSAFYHLAPDNARLVWDRLPIAMACAGLLAAVRADTRGRPVSGLSVIGWLLLAVASVLWWWLTDAADEGDLRPYLLLQLLPIVLLPLWQAIGGAPRGERVSVGLALALYVVAKVAELCDHSLHEMLGVLSGHTLKHLLATLAAALIVGGLVRRVASLSRRMPPARPALRTAAGKAPISGTP